MKTKTGHYITMVLLCIITLIAMFPFYLMVIMSTHEHRAIVQSLNLLPGKYFFNNALQVFKAGFLRYYWNSLYIALIASAIGVIMSAMAGYALSKYKFRLETNF